MALAAGGSDSVSGEALDAVTAYLENAGIAHATCEVVRKTSDRGAGPAIRITGWEGGHAAIGDIFGPDGAVIIGSGYPHGVANVGDSPIRPTLYGSAYGLRHPDAQEALRRSAIVAVDRLGDLEGEDLGEFLPPDARYLIDEKLVADFIDTLVLVGWKFGQPRPLALSSLAEQIAATMLIEQAEWLLEPTSEGTLTREGARQAMGELGAFRALVLGKEGALDDLQHRVEQTFASWEAPGLPSARALLWAPRYPMAGNPPPRITGDDEPRWTLTASLGLTPRELAASEGTEATARHEGEMQARRERLVSEFAGLDWRRDNLGEPCLAAETPDGDFACLRPPSPLDGAEGTGTWTYERHQSRESASAQMDPREREVLEWPEVFVAYPVSLHPMAVDTVFSVITEGMEWASAVGGHALPAGSATPIRETAAALEGVLAMRRHLEGCRTMDLVRDERLTHFGLRHELFGSSELRFLAEARFAMPADRDFDQIESAFNEAVLDFGPLPMSLGIEPDDDSLIVSCGIGAESIQAASELANEVIARISWRTRLRSIDLQTGAQSAEVGFDITDLGRGPDKPED